MITLGLFLAALFFAYRFFANAESSSFGPVPDFMSGVVAAILFFSAIAFWAGSAGR